MILIRGGQIVTSEGVRDGDLLIKGKRIAQVGGCIAAGRANTVEAGGLLVLPGLVDAHVHLRDPGETHKEDFFTGTCAALSGGVTTVLDMPNNRPPITSLERFRLKQKEIGPKALADYGLFLGATKDNWREVVAPRGNTGPVALKMFLGATSGELLVAGFASQYLHMLSYPGERVLAVHAEDQEALGYFAEHPVAPGHSGTHPPLTALLAIARALALAEAAGRRLHICHLSTPQERDAVREAKRHGLPVTCEVTPHHLFLTQEDEKRLGPLGKMNPPLRSKGEVEALWRSLADIDIIASDHAPHTLEEKRSASPPSGVPGLETMLPLLATAASGGRLAWEDVARLAAENPARIFGLKGKGRIAVGYDADLVLLDPQAEWEIGASTLFTKCGWTPFEGWKVQGKVVSVYLRGREVFREGQVLVQPGYGREVRLAEGE